MRSESFTENDFKSKLDFLKRFNALLYHGKPLSHQKIFEKYNVWVFFQSRIFFNDLRDLGLERSLMKDHKPSIMVKIQNFVLALFGVLESMLAIGMGTIFKKKFFVYGVDRDNSKVFNNDARMDPVYQYIKVSGEPFIEFFHTTFDFAFLKRFFLRKRFAFYIRAIDSIFHFLNLFGLVTRTKFDPDEVVLTPLGEKEQPFAKSLLLKYFEAIDKTVFKVRVLKTILPWMGAKTLLAIDNTRDYWELILACRMNGIKTYAFQHGHFTKYHMGWLDDGSFEGEIVHPDKLFVWSDYWKNELLRLGTYFPPNSIEVGGLKSVVPVSTQSSERDYIGVLVPYEVDSNKPEVKKYIDKLLSCNNIKIFFKLRTDLDINRQMSEYCIGEDYSPDLEFITDTSKYLPQIDVVAGTYSTFLYDMVAFERPIALLQTASDFGEGLVVNELADLVTIEDACDKIKDISRTSKDALIKRKEKLFGERPALMYDTVRSLCSRK
jgi:hypothetical protein